MFRTRLKHQIISILQDFHTLHAKMLQESSTELRLRLLCDAQEEAISLASQIEKLVEDSAQVVRCLSDYCEMVYQMAQENALDTNALDQKISEAASALENLSSVSLVYFLPYKASMWDCLESIYLAAAQDPAVEARVMPIPYYEFDQVSQNLRECWEKDLFPKSIPIIDYRTVNLKAIHPDVIYIHNPYDDTNAITSVKPCYFSDQLKEATDCLVYVPYYVTSGFFSKDQQLVPTMQNITRMVVQSQHFKDDAKTQPYYDRLLPLGSPKLDKVIHMCQNSSALHPEWADFIAGRKTLMLNTSINAMLHDTNAYLTKLEHLFDYFSKRTDIALVWRPHPLLAATFRAARIDLYARYQALVDRFVSEKIGILDQSPSIEETIAVSDAYIGDNSTSVINLFGAAGKPLFILNSNILHAPDDIARRKIRLIQLIPGTEDADNDYLLTDIGLCRVPDHDFSRIEYLGQNTPGTCWHHSSMPAVMVRGQIFLSPYLSRQFCIYNTASGKYVKPEDSTHVLPDTDPVWSDVFHYSAAFCYEDRIVWLPGQEKCCFPDAVLMYSLSKHQFHVLPGAFTDWKGSASRPFYGAYFNSLSHEKDGRYVYATADYSGLVLCLDLKNGATHLIPVTDDPMAVFTAVASAGNFLYLVRLSQDNRVSLIVYNLSNGTNQELPLPYDGHTWEDWAGNCRPASCIIPVGDSLYLIPCLSDLLLKVDIATKNVTVVQPDLFCSQPDDRVGYSRPDTPVCPFAQYVPGRGLYLQNSLDNTLYLLNPDDDSVREIPCQLSSDSLDRFYAQTDGFDKDSIDAEFSQKECTLFSLNSFLDDLTSHPDKMTAIHGRQMKELQPLAANLDGTCGEKTHQEIMQIVKRPLFRTACKHLRNVSPQT